VRVSSFRAVVVSLIYSEQGRVKVEIRLFEEGSREDFVKIGNVLVRFTRIILVRGFLSVPNTGMWRRAGRKLERIRKDSPYAQFAPIFAARIKTVEEIERRLGNKS
jgi:hypothetical protein